MAEDLIKVNNFTTRVRSIAPQVLDLLAQADGLSAEWFANQWNSGGNQEIVDADLLGDNAELSAAELQLVMFTIDTFKNTLDGAHRSNLHVARP